MRYTQSRRAGFTLIELLISITVLVGLTGATYALFRSQSESFRGNTNRFDLVQNARGSLEATERVIRTMGAGVTGDQPMMVYGNDNTLSLNTDYVERDTVDMRWAAYWNPDSPVAETVVWKVANAAAIPRSSPSYTYPSETYLLGNGSESPAETWTIFFELDGDTPRSDDYRLMQQVNAGTPEIITRNILAASDGSPFFQYLLQRVLNTGDTLFTASGSLLPLIRRKLVSGISTADSANYTRPDSVRAIKMNYGVTNGLSGSEEQIREISTMIETPNNGVAMPTICGRPPLPPGGLTAAQLDPTEATITLTWGRSTDQDAGEIDVRQYVVWRKVSTDPLFGPPVLVVRAERDTTSYTTDLTDILWSTTYNFAVSAQDCTPNFSTNVLTSITLPAPPP